MSQRVGLICNGFKQVVLEVGNFCPLIHDLFCKNFVRLLETFVDPCIKIIVLERPIVEIVKSFSKLYQQNGKDFNALDMLKPMSEPLMRSKAGVDWAKKNNDKNTFLFLEYKELVEEPQKVIDKIYKFCGWEPFVHSFTQIKVKYPEKDEVYQLQGQHTIRSSIGAIENLIELSHEVVDKCLEI